MNYYTIKNFKKLDNIFLKILNSNFSSWRTFCISNLQFIKPHPEYFIKYKYYLSKNFLIFIFFLIRCFLNLFLKVLKWFVRKIEDDILNIFYSKNNNLKEKKTDIIFITSLVNANTLSARKNSNNDFIFGNIIKHLRNRYKVKVIYLNLTRLNSKKIFNILKKNREIYVLDKILSISREFKILKSQFNEFFNLFLNLPIREIGIKNYILILINIFSYETRNNFRIRLQIEKIIKSLNPSLVTLSYEGNCWEKNVFSVCKSIESEIQCKTVGYQHAGIMNYQTIINHNYKKKFNPDYIITSGKNNIKYFSKFLKRGNKKNKNKIYEIGSNRYLRSSNRKIPFNKNDNILILPEGTYEETKILFDLSIDLAKKYQKKNFILRTHPQININHFSKNFFFLEKYKNFKNLIFSNKSFNHDLNRSSSIIYRGSTGVITAILKGLIPIYFKQSNEYLNLDPIFDLKKFRKYMKKTNNLNKILDNKKNRSNEYKIAKTFCSNYFTPQKSSKTLSIFKQIMSKS